MMPLQKVIYQFPKAQTSKNQKLQKKRNAIRMLIAHKPTAKLAQQAISE
jgi:hypothetical protein